MPKQKYSDEQLIEMINDSRYVNNNQIVKALGAKSYGSLNNRLNQLRKKNGMPVTDGRTKPGLETALTIPDVTEAKPTKWGRGPLDPFPFEPKDQVIFDGRLHAVRSVDCEKLVMYENASMRRKTVTIEEWNRNPDIVRSAEKKPEHRYEDVSRDYPPESVEDLFEKKPIERSPSDRKPATDNPDFATVFEIPAMGPTGSGGNVKPEPAEKTKFEQVAERMKKETPPKVVDKGDGYSEIVRAEPSHIDLEMDPIHDDQMDPAYLFDRAPDMEREISDSLTRHREYLDWIDRLLDVMMPLGDDSLRERTKLLAERILFMGIDGEVGV